MNDWLVIHCDRAHHTGLIARHLAQRLDSRFCDVRVRSLRSVDAEALPACTGIVVGATIHASGFCSELKRFLVRHHELLNACRSGLFSVSLDAAASDPSVRREAGQRTVALAEECGWYPQVCAAFAGEILPEECGPWERFLLRRKLRRLFGPDARPDGRELTDWRTVGAFVDNLVPSAM